MSCSNQDRKLYIGNDMPVEVSDYRNTFEDDEPIIDAMMTVTAKDQNGNLVTGVSWPLTLVYDATRGSYRGTIQSDANWIEGTQYDFTFSATSPGGLDAQWWTTMTAEKRKL